MDSAQKTLIEIASVSQRVVDKLDRCVGRKTVESLRLDKIFVGARVVFEALNKTFVLKDGNADERLLDWLKGEEPQACLRTLNQMEEILNRKVDYGVKNLFKTSWSTHTQEKNSEAIRLFQMRKDYFHFLLMTGIWNREGGAQQQPRSTTQPDVLQINQTPDGRGLGTTTESMNDKHSRVAQGRRTSKLDGKEGVNFGELDGILEWLNAWNSRGTHERTVLLRQRDTCTWLPNTSAYKIWRSTEMSFLWLHGKPGAGKSVLAASVIERLRDTLQDGEILAYFYCDFREERSTSAAEVMRSLLSQLLQQSRRRGANPGDLIHDLVEERDGGATTISNVTLLARHVSRAAKQFHELPLLVIDALDECKDIKELLDALVELKGGVRLLAISRPLQVIKDSFSGLPFIDMEAMGYEVLADIRLHVTRELDSHRRLRIIDANLKDEIYAALYKKAGGMFRWVQCQLNTLKECMTASEIREALRNLPSDLNGTYGRILLEIDRAKRAGEVARRTLSWLAVALEPLQLSQIIEALSIDINGRTSNRDFCPVHGAVLLDALSSLVTYNEGTDVIILSHFSVKEYLMAEPTRKEHPAYHVDQQAAHTQLALLCLYYVGIYLRHHQKANDYEGLPRDTYKLRIRRDNPDAIPSRSKTYAGASLQLFESHPLLQYVLSVGFQHLSHVNPRNKEILCAIRDFQLNAEQHPLGWEQLCERTNSLDDLYPTIRHDLALYILIAFAPEPLLRSFCRTGLRLMDGTNPLIYAARFRKTEHARTLLSIGTNPNLRGLNTWDSRVVLPLEVAVWSRDRTMVDLLLDEGSQVPCKFFESALAKNYYYFPAWFVSRLLQTDEFAEWAAGIHDGSLLSYTLDHRRYHGPNAELSEEDIDIVQRRLVQIGYDPPARFDEASIRYAVSSGHVSTVKHMLSLNTPFPPDVILDASHSTVSNATMISLLLGMGCEVDVTSPVGDTPLHLVMNPRLSEHDCFESVRVLIDAGCDPSACNLAGETPLHLAARHGYVSLAEYLLSLQVLLPPNIMLEASQAAMIYFLIRQGASTRVIAADGNTPLHRVLVSGSWPPISSDVFLERAEMLIDAGCNPCLPNALGKTAIDVAAGGGHLPVVQYLLSIGVSFPPSILLSVVGGYHSTVTPVIKFLIDKGADLRATRLNGDTLLHLAMTEESEVECLKRIKILVDAGCDPRARNSAGKTPFHIAASLQYVLVMEYLLSLGISVPPDIMLNQLEWTTSPAPQRYYSVTRFLLDNGSDVHTISENGDTLLHIAAGFRNEHDALEVSKLLVHAGCKPSISNSKHELPLHIAAQRGYISAIDYFLSLGISLPPNILLAASAGFTEKTLVIRFTEKTLVIRYLIDKGADISAVTSDGDTPLHLLVAWGSEDDHLETMKILIDAGCDPRAHNVSGKTPLHVAAQHGFISNLKYLLSLDVPLPHDILATSAPSTIRFLFGRGVDVRCSAANIDMQLMHSALNYPDEESCLECAKILVSAGWDPSLRNSAGETPFYIAARHSYIYIIQYLLSQSVTLPQLDVLIAAVPSDEHWYTIRTIPVIRLLIREGASVNASASNGDTPLHLTLRSRSIIDEVIESNQMKSWKVVEILLDCGADPSARNADGQTPFDIAQAKGHFFKENFLRLVRIAHHVQSSS